MEKKFALLPVLDDRVVWTIVPADRIKYIEEIDGERCALYFNDEDCRLVLACDIFSAYNKVKGN